MITEVDFQSTIESAFLKYSASVAQERAIPDVRDMLKIGLRQGLYAQYSNKITYDNKFQKAQKSVAAAMAQSYLHGDVAMYDTFIRAARNWSYRYPLEDVQGNYGNQTSPNSHAASRYVEMKTSPITQYFFNGLKKNAIGNEWYKNYDDTEDIPSVFPSIGFWNIVNGCSGIAVALATSVPCFNLKEVNEALIKIIKDKDISFDEIYCEPDFPTGGTIVNKSIVKESLRNGCGESIRLRATLKYVQNQNMIQVTELPYGVFVNTVIEQLAELTNNDENYGIEKVVDYTKKLADIHIYLSKNVNPQKMIEKLYKDTSLENYFSINMTLLDNGRFPKIFSWKEACNAYITHIRSCKTNEIQFDLNKALARQNVVEGLIIAAANIDEIVSIIRSSENPTEAAEKLINRFHFNNEQVKAILAIKLSSLTRIDGVQLNEELAELKVKIDNYHYLLSDSVALDSELIKVLQEVANKFGDERRTKVIDLIEEKEEVKEVNVKLQCLNNDNIRIIDISAPIKKLPKGIEVNKEYVTTNLSSVKVVSNLGRLYQFTLSELDFGQEYPISSILSFQSDEKPLIILPVFDFSSYSYIVTISSSNLIKKIATNEFSNQNSKKGSSIVKLENGAYLLNASMCQEKGYDVLTFGSNNFYVRFSLDEVAATGKTAKGIKVMKLKDDEHIEKGYIFNIDDAIIKNGNDILMSKNYIVTGRAVKGHKNE